MSNSVDEALEALYELNLLASHKAQFSERRQLIQLVRSTLTAQQQRIEALEEVLRHAVSVHGGSRGSQYKWLEHAQELLSDEALNEATRIAQETGLYDS